MTLFEKRQLRIALRALQMPPELAKVMGLSHKEAKEILENYEEVKK